MKMTHKSRIKMKEAQLEVWKNRKNCPDCMLMFRLKRWITNRTNNYGWNDTLIALQAMVKEWETKQEACLPDCGHPEYDCLEERFDRLLDYLGLEEVERPAQTKIKKKSKAQLASEGDYEKTM